MGVPKFYRWISERYPCLSEVVKDYQIPEFDNLYLDMNGIIHVCSHPEDDNPHFRITEEKIMQDIFHYIEVLFRMIKPRKVFFMAVDGVAPRAKMNQQRGRRFRSAREAEDLMKKAVEKGETLPTEARFDSNCITPGTEFMVRLHEQLQYFVVKKVSTDSLWQGVRIILSGHETPGEGEHKVMDFIRYEKSQPDYDPNTRHCLYGLDADLIMLGLSSHEPHFSLLREEVKFGKKAQKRISTVEETTFHLLHLSLMREYIDYEFASLKDKLPFGYNLENIIDDWVLMGFLVGNDFIPHLPDMHIHHDALPLLWKTYKKVLPTLNGYLNNRGELNLENFEKYLRVLAKVDFDNFTEKHADLKWLESRAECRNANKHHALTSDEVGIPTADEFMQKKNDESADDDFSAFQKQDFDAMMAEFDFSEEEEDDSEDEEQNTFDEQFFTDFRNFKADYYRDKLEFQDVNQEVLKEQALGYVKAIQWILYYYFKGVPSWSWYYPHHYAPYLSDVRDFSNMNMEFEFSKPFLPFQQLMAVLPAASKNLMPVPLQSLMLSENSPVKDYYPVDFKTDLNGKQQPWEAVVLIPFIDENRLINAMTPLEDKLTDEEKSRNKHGPHIMFEYVAESQGTYTSSMFPDVYNYHAKITYLPLDLFWMRDKSMLRQGLCPGVRLDVYFPGFPTLKHIPHKAELQRCGVRVFQHVSKGENMMLTITKENKQTLKDIADDLIGQSIYVSWPHLSEAQVIAVSDGEIKYYWLKDKSKQSADKVKVVIECDRLTEEESNIWRKEVHHIAEEYQYRKGVFIGNTEVLVYACPLAGNRYIYSRHGDVVLEKQWSVSSYAFALQASVKEISVKDPTYKQFKTLVDLFSPKSDVFMLGEPKYGCKGEVIDVDMKNVRIRVDFTVLQEPDLAMVQSESKISRTYFPGYQLARRLGLSSLMLSRITGCVFVIKTSPDSEKKPEHSDRMNVGLNLKLNKSNQEVPGYTKKGDNEWLYSDALEMTIYNYITEFPELFDYISQNANENTYYAAHIFGKDNSKKRLQELSTFLKQLHCTKVQPVPQGSEILDELVVMEIEKQVEQVQEVNRKKKRHIKMQVRPHLLFRPLEAQLTLVPDPSTTYRLFDRIVNVRQGFSVPLGLRGTIIGIANAEKERDVLYDVVFDEAFLGGLTLRCSPGRGYRMPNTAMINLSHGERKSAGTMAPINKPTAVVKPQSSANTYAKAAAAAGGRQTQHHSAKSRGGYNNNNANRFCDVLETRLQNSHQVRQQSFGRSQQQLDTQQYQNQGNCVGQHQQARHNQQSQDEFTDLWKQLQKAQLTASESSKLSEATGQSSQTSSGKREGLETSLPKSSNQMPRQGKATLENAASALKSSFQQESKTAGKRNPKSKAQDQTQGQTAIHKIDIEALMNSENNIVKFVPSKNQLRHHSSKEEQLSGDPDLSVDGMLTQQEHDQRKEDPDIQKGRAVLCQMLNIVPESLDKPEAKGQIGGNQDDGKPNNPKHISVQQLFAIAKQHDQQQEVRTQGHAKVPGSEHKKSTVELLAEWCQTVGMPQPKYDYQLGRDNKQRAVITLANGQRFSGCYTQSGDQAAELAAGIALTQLHQPPGGSSRFAYQQGPLQPHQGPKHLSTSPNSAFTPVKPPPQGLAQNQLQMCPAWLQRPGAPFHPAPPFGMIAAVQQMGRVRGPYQPPPAQKGQRFPPTNWPQQRPNWPQQPNWQQQQQNRPQQHPNWPQHQAQHSHNYQQQQQQQQHQGMNWAARQGKDPGARSHQPCAGVKEHSPGTGSTVNQSTTLQQDATKGASAFIPLQVMQKQKTPQKPTKEPTDNHMTLPPGEQTEEQKQMRSSNQTSLSDNNKPEKLSSDKQPESDSKSTQSTKTSNSNVNASSTASKSKKPSGGSVLPPTHRPKSRIAARFPAAN